MSYLDNVLESNDNYYNRRQGCRLPHDNVMDKPSELAQLSGEVTTYQLGEGDRFETS